MKKKQLNLLAFKYQKLKGDKSKMFKTILDVVRPMSEYIRRKFNYNFIALIDFDSVVCEALLKALNKYSHGSGHFANYYMTWLSSTLTREAIKSQPGIRLPEHLAKKNFQISDEARQLMIKGIAKEDIKDIYKLSESQYNGLVHYYTEVPRFLEHKSEDCYIDIDISIDIQKVLDAVPQHYRKPIVFYFGLFGNSCQTPAQIKSYYKVDVEEILEYLEDNEDIKKLIGEYYE